MNKKDVIIQTAEQTGLSKKDAERAVNTALETIANALLAGDRVQLSGFGIFEVKERKGRMARNLQSQQEVWVPASRVPTFKPSKTLKDSLNKK